MGPQWTFPGGASRRLTSDPMIPDAVTEETRSRRDCNNTMDMYIDLDSERYQIITPRPAPLIRNLQTNSRTPGRSSKHRNFSDLALHVRSGEARVALDSKKHDPLPDAADRPRSTFSTTNDEGQGYR
ncbi:hypothetical protein N7467_000725 [Penicillium canescens]|nr:hypothetical protein N7467_000725 [Penicillium canescens]